MTERFPITRNGRGWTVWLELGGKRREVAKLPSVTREKACALRDQLLEIYALGFVHGRNEADERVTQAAGQAQELRRAFNRRWRCGVVTSGYHNGAGCTPDDPHTSWGCGYYHSAALTDADWEALS